MNMKIIVFLDVMYCSLVEECAASSFRGNGRSEFL
jgi:hypothetical protein